MRLFINSAEVSQRKRMFESQVGTVLRVRKHPLQLTSADQMQGTLTKTLRPIRAVFEGDLHELTSCASRG